MTSSIPHLLNTSGGIPSRPDTLLSMIDFLIFGTFDV